MTDLYTAPWRTGGKSPEVPRSLYHGGPAGFEVGALILPVSETGRKPYGDFQRRDRVYLTSDPDIAEQYACRHRRGAVYLVEAVGEFEPDPEGGYRVTGWTRCFAAEAARVLGVVRECVFESRYDTEAVRRRERMRVNQSRAAPRLCRLEAEE